MTLQQALTNIAAHPSPLIISDFDGTLAPLHDEPSAVRLPREAVRVLETLAASGAYTYVLSGRGFDDLRQRTGHVEGVTLLGSYGYERGPNSLCLSSAEVAQRSLLRNRVMKTLEFFRPAWMECKPLGAAIHLRLLSRTTQNDCRAALVASLAEFPELHIHHDVTTMEVAVRPYSKRAALSSIRLHHPEGPCVYAGDDASDEEALSSLRTPDCSIVVGERTSQAEYRVAYPTDLVNALAQLAVQRTHHATTQTTQSSPSS
ncbi:MAG: trehalose-phosphatase [Phycisphaerales bacterium]